MSQDDTAAYTPMAPYYDTSVEPVPPAPTRAPRRGPLSARLEARARMTPLPDSATLSAADPTGVAEQQFADGDTELLDASTSAQAGPVWEMLTGVLRGPGDATETLREDNAFGARWGSRADMLGACLDEYYRMTTRFNEARALLKETEQEIAPLRQQRLASYKTLRELEARLELHSRAELRAAYLGAAEIEMRVFRAEQDRDLLSNQVETLEGFLGFLSRIISTIRTIPAEAMEQPASAEDAEQAFDAVVGDASATAAVKAAGSEDAETYEELVIDADEAEALAARGDVEVIGAVEVEEVEEVEEVDAASAQPPDESSAAE